MTGSAYIAGLWLHRIKDRGLLWEQFNKGVHQRITTLPTWSWASIHAQVRWMDHRPSDQSPPDAVTTHIGKATVLKQTWAEINLINNQPSSAITTPTGHSTPDAQVMVLCLHAKIQHVILGQFFSSEEDKQLVGDLAWRRPMVGMDSWRTVASPLDPKHIAGWASIEHPDMQIDKIDPNRDPGTPHGEIVCALYVSTVPGVPGGIPLGYLSTAHHVYNVLFVRRARNTRDGYYERVGVGRLFGREMDQGLKQATAKEVYLI
ncbi:hypothetical protein B0T25DRAFT_223712 [Lasiosphaeria hispida]|uniref:Uncharacterized protein n=1 Tax=Lasiosphaeria hispida TaxID=260671 RepID=A0AAJ0HKD2_9PEZI|nr:hypothetical protein B0T25DRAFT_223712 [Lasiosphaeria hispida]